MKKIIITLFIFLIMFGLFACSNIKKANAETLSESIDSQLENLDLSELENFFNDIEDNPQKGGFIDNIKNLLNGTSNFDYNSLLNYTLQIFFSRVYNLLPIMISIVAIALFSGLINNIKTSFLSDSISDIIFFVCLLTIILLLSSTLISSYENIKNAIENIAKLSEIMSPIIITLMVASGGNTSAAIYTPTVSFLSNGIITIILSFILPLVTCIFIFGIVSNFSKSIKLNKFIQFFESIIKWTLGLIITIFSVFVTIQGITSASFDGISIKATKYTISNSVPIIGGFLKDGFDLIIAGSVLIKNAVGVGVIFSLFYTILSPVLFLGALSLMLKLVASIIEPISDERISNFCMQTSKSITYLNVCILMVGFMFFIIVLLMICSANAFV